MDPVALMMQMPWHWYTAGGQCWFKMPKAEEHGRQAGLATRLAQGEKQKEKRQAAGKMQKYLARAEVDPTGTADMPATSFTKHPEDERLHQMRLAASLGTGAARAAPQDEETEEEE